MVRRGQTLEPMCRQRRLDLLQLAVGCERMCTLKNNSQVFGLSHMELSLTEMEEVRRSRLGLGE